MILSISPDISASIFSILYFYILHVSLNLFKDIFRKNIMSEYIGFSALFLSTIYRIPQIYKMCKNKSVQDISLSMFLVQSVSYVLYTIYGLMIHDIVYISSSALSLVQNMIIILLYCIYRGNTNEKIENLNFNNTKSNNV
jgi:uncharacterized protein with PQ loop repeat